MTDSASFQDEEGRQKVRVTTKPINHFTYFTGQGDDLENQSIGGGPRLNFLMASTDTTKSVDLQFINKVYIKDGYIITSNAPLGAALDVTVHNPNDDSIVAIFANKIPLLHSNNIPLNAEDRAGIDQGLILRVTVHNSIDNASDFSVAGRMELFRPDSMNY